MSFVRNFSSNKNNRRVVSDIRPSKKAVQGRSEIIREEVEPKIKKQPYGKRLFKKSVFSKPRNKFPKKIYKYFIAGIIIIAVLFVVAFLTSSLTLIVVPKKTAFELGNGISITVPADIFEVSASKRGEAKSSSVEDFNNKAEGNIIVYNAFSSASQVLVKTTRFETPTGLVYRTTERVVIPGRSGEKPGSVEVAVVADKAGDEYNIGLTDFTIPGFKGSPKYQGFYGRSKSKMKGGAVGKGKVVGAEEASKLLDELQVSVEKDLRAKLDGAIPENYIYFQNERDKFKLAAITDPEVGSPAETFFGEVRAEWKTMAVDSKVYGEALAKLLFQDKYSEGAYVLRDTSDLVVKSSKPDFDRKRITVSLTGRAVFEWQLDQAALANAVIAADTISDLESIFGSYPAISRVEAVYNPGFIKRIPSSINRLNIKISE